MKHKHLRKSTLLVFAFFVSSVLATFTHSNAAVPITAMPLEGMITLAESRPHVARTGAWQTWNDYIDLKPGRERRKLLLIFTNGADGRTKLTDLKVSLAGQPFATITDFDAAGKLSRDLSDKLPAGKTLVTVQVFGPSGARLAWKLFTEKVIVTSVQPNPFKRDDKLTVQGVNFSDRIQNIKVSIGSKTVKVTSATNTELQLKLPSDLPGGQQDMFVYTDSIKSNVFKVTGSASPQVTGTNLFSTAPGNQVVIYGKNFSPNPAENVVTFGRFRAHIVHATENSITCIVPQMDFPNWHLPIVVTTNGMQSKERVTFNVDIRHIPH